MDDRGVEDLAPLVDLADCSLLCRGHALQHLGVEHVQHAAGVAELVAQSGGEQVVGSNADAYGVGELFAHDVIQQAVVVRIHVCLVGVGSNRPAMDLTLDVLHG